MVNQEDSYLSDMGRDRRPPSREEGAARAKALAFYLRRVIGKIPRGAAADVGCGRGEVLLALCGLGFSPVEGCDIGAEQVAAASAAGLSATRSDAASFLASRRDLSLVTAFDVVEHLSREGGDELLAAAWRALRPGGFLVLQHPNPSSPFFGAVQFADPTHLSVVGPEALAHRLRKAGFGDVSLHEAGPVPNAPVRMVRYALWKGVRTALRILDAIETGNLSGGPYTRVVLVSAKKASG